MLLSIKVLCLCVLCVILGFHRLLCRDDRLYVWLVHLDYLDGVELLK